MTLLPRFFKLSPHLLPLSVKSVNLNIKLLSPQEANIEGRA